MADVSSAARDVYTELVTSFGSSKEPRDLYGTASVSAAGGMVHVDGAPEAVKCHFSVNCLDGDRVMVRVIDHRPVVIANLTNPDLSTAEVISHVKDNPNTGVVQNIVVSDSTLQDIDLHGFLATDGTIENTKISGGSIDGATLTNIPYAAIDELDAHSAEIADARIGQATITQAQVENLVADKATINGKLTAAEGDITNLKAKDVEIEGNVTAATGRIGTLESDNVTVKGRLDAAEADIGDLEAEDARITNLVAGKASITDLNAATGRITTLESTKANISDLEANYITAANIEATYMHANMSNSDVAWISNGVIANGAISSAMINDVSANKLTAGTINGSVINVTNLNADNITAGTINGQRIGEGSLSLDKLSEDVYTEAEVDAMLDTMQSEIDGAIETWTGTEVPTLNNAPASSWTTAADRDKHVGDVYFNTTSGYNYRFTKSGTGSSATYSWLQIKDTDITNALQRIQTAEGKITTFDSDISTLKTDTGELKTKTQSLETSLGDKVDTTTFNELEETVDGHTQTISQHTTAISNKADSSTVTAVTNRVSKNEQDISGINTTIGELQTTVASKADGSTVETISSKLNTVSDTVDGHTQTISSVQNTLSTKADNSTVQTLRSEYNETKTTVAGTVTRLGQVEETANGVRSDLDNLSIGGRNLWIASEAVEGYETSGDYTGAAPHFHMERYYDVTPGEPITYQHWNPDLIDNTANWNRIAWYDSSKAYILSEVVPHVSAANGTHCTAKFTAPDNAAYIRLGAMYDNGESSVKVKFERGNMATDWTPAPEDTGAEITELKTDYATFKQEVTGFEATVGTTYATKTELGAKRDKTMPDTRNDNQSPAWYMSNYPKQEITEFKYASVIGLSGENFCYLTTTVPWSDPSGGYPKQQAQVGDKLYWRVGTSDVAWSEWQEGGKASDIANLGRRVTTAETSIQSNAEQISLRATKAEVTELEMSERNLGLKSQKLGTPSKDNRVFGKYGDSSSTRDRADGFTEIVASGQWAGVSIYANSLGLSVGDTVTLSVNLKTEAVIPDNVTFYMMAFNSSGQRVQDALLYIKTRLLKGAGAAAAIYNNSTFPANHDERIWVTITWLQAAQDFIDGGGSINLTIQVTSQQWSQGSMVLYAPKLNRGDKAGEWTPAPEDAADYTDSQISTAKAEIKVTTDGITSEVEKKTDKATIISTIRQSAETVKIKASQVEIDGTAIFTAISDDVDDAITDKGYQTSSDVSAAISTGTANLAAKADAVARTQRIYYRQTASGSAPGVNNTWLSTSGTGYGNWSLSIPQLTNGTTKYPKLYMATQTQTVAQQAAGTTCSCSTPQLDDSTTIIDGGNIITGSVTANQLNATSINASHTLTIGAMATETQESILNSNVDVPTSLGQLENDVGYTTGEQVSRNFYQEDEPEPPYSVGDTWMTGSGTVKVCAISKDEGDSYDASDWVDADDTAASLANLSANIGQVETNLKAEMSSTEEKLAQDITDAANSAKDALEGVEARVNSELADAQEWRNYLRFTTEDGLTIGQSDSSLYRQVMDAHGTHWQYDGEDAASVQVDAEGNGVMVLDRSEVADRMRIGDYIWINRGGRINLRYDPVEE